MSEFVDREKGGESPFSLNNAQTDKYWNRHRKKFVTGDQQVSPPGKPVVEMLSVFDELAGLAVVAFDVDAWCEPIGIAACRKTVDGEEAVVGS